MEPVPEEMTQADLDRTRGPSRVLMVLGVLVALMLALAGAAVLYSSIEPQNHAADTRSISVAQLQPAETETAEDANARAAADRVLAESLTRQASQTQAALAAADGNVAASLAVAPPAPAPASEPPPPAATQLAALSPRAVVETPPVDVMPTATVPLPPPTTAAPVAPAANLPAAPRSLVQEAVKAPDAEKIGAPAAPAAPVAPAAPPAAAVPAAAGPAVSMSPEEATRMLTRASVMIQQGDIASARLMLDRLARASDGRAMYLLAKTFDPKMLAQWNVRGIKPDTARAKFLYGEAVKAGISEARDRLIALDN